MALALVYIYIYVYIQFGVLINFWRLAGDSLNITCNLLYCYHQVRRIFITLCNCHSAQRHILLKL
jgi:hypothetical protein